jgi:HTH-type transcriptional regulator, competence development regulator
MDEQMTFGAFIKAARIKARISQRDLADRAGIDFTYLSKIENDKMAPPSEETIRKIADVLGEEPETLIILADKIPSNYKEVLQSSPTVPMLLRTISQLSNTSKEALLKKAEDLRSKE